MEYNLPNETDSMLKRQYADSRNFMARVELKKRFGTNPYSWNRWIFDQFSFQEETEMLELGCGSAILWKINFRRIPKGVRIILSDFSEGMLADAKNFLGTTADNFKFQIIDAQQIPYSDCSFDLVIANLMLYHIPDRKKAFTEIGRVLKPGGTLYATTMGKANMKELIDLVSAYDPAIHFTLGSAADRFGLENGEQQLAKYFTEIKMLSYKDSLLVTEAQPLVDYVLSFAGLSDVAEIICGEKRHDFTKYVNEILKEHNGVFKITKDSGMFIARK